MCVLMFIFGSVVLCVYPGGQTVFVSKRENKEIGQKHLNTGSDFNFNSGDYYK